MYIKKKKTKKLFFISLIILLLAAGAFFAWQQYSSNNSQDEQSNETNYSPPSDAEKTETEQNKEEIIKETEEENANQAKTTPSTAKKTVTPIISYAGQQSSGADFEANGYVQGIIEKGGTCTLTLSSGSKSVKTTRTALDNAQDTSCGLMTISKSKLSSGSWQATLSYSSTKASGTSKPMTVGVQ